MKRRLLLAIPNLGAGGAEAQTRYLAAGLAKRGDDVTVVCLQRASIGTDRLERAGVSIVELHAHGWAGKARAMKPLLRLVGEVDLVHCALWDASLLARVVALARRRPVTVADHSTDRALQVSEAGRPRARWIALHHRALSPFTFATVVCAATQRPLLLREGVARERIVHIANGVPLEDLRRAAQVAVTRERLGIPARASVVLHVGRLVPDKNQRATVDAVATLRRTLGDVHAVFVGDGPDRSAPKRAEELGANWAHFLGTRADVPALLAMADIAVLPSRNDAMPMVMLEAMALGVPLVATAVGDIGAVLRDTGAGVVLRPGDHAAFVEACRSLLQDGDRRERISDRAREASARFDVEAMVTRYSRLFDAALRRATQK
jgi:glycosyltransferase involved in cell wall biosynthesis